jgi:WD40 repeat protein
VSRWQEDNDRVRIWDTATGQELARLEGHTQEVHTAVFSPDGRRVATATRDATVRTWDASSGQELACIRGMPAVGLKGMPASGLFVAFSPDGERLVTAHGHAEVWEAATGKRLSVLTGDDTHWVYSAVFSPDGRRLVSRSAGPWTSTYNVGEDISAVVWDAETGRKLAVLKDSDPQNVGSCSSAVFSADGKRILTASYDETARIWDAESGKELLVLRGHTAEVNAAVPSPDGGRVLTASKDKTARIWDAQTGKELLVLKGHEEAVHAAAWSADGKQVLTVGDDRSVRVWDAGTGRETATYSDPEAGVRSAQFGPDGQRVYAWLEVGRAVVWPVDLLAAAVRRKPRELTSAEHERFAMPRAELDGGMANRAGERTPAGQAGR